MRNAFADEATKLAREDSRVVLLSGDIGNKLFDKFKLVDERRFYNCGVAEANMMGVAAGMALSGLRPIVYTITPFTTTRCFEQIRVDACYHNAPVIIVGTGAGMSYADLGPTHHSLEDMAILRTLPGMRVLAPCDIAELRQALRAALKEDAPVYIRIGKKGEPDIHSTPPEFMIGKGIVIRPGTEVALIVAGTIMPAALEAAQLLQAQGISAEVVSFHSVKPLDTGYLDAACQRFKLIATVEEHGRVGGLGGAVAEWRADKRDAPMQLRFGTADEFMHEVGSQDYARTKFGLTGANIAGKISAALGGCLGVAPMRIGIDFDNTIVSYDALFHAVAAESKLVPAATPANKNAVRNYLRQAGQEDKWTEMQGTVYGARMDEASAFEGVLAFIRAMQETGHELFIVSHKTRHPFLGPAYDLHGAARSWVGKHLVTEGKALLPADRIFFELTKAEKLARIAACGCDAFIDDLPEILLDPGFPSGTQRLLFDPERHHEPAAADGVQVFRSWQELAAHFQP